MPQTHTHKCIIIGSGFSGIGLGIMLQKEGIDDFLLLEKASEVGGTWRDNHYPGAECDVPSALYSYSFETKTDWDYQWSEQAQILDYIKSTVQRHGLRQHIKLDTEVLGARYDEVRQRWQILLRGEEELYSQFLISAVGQLHKPYIPDIPGREDFAGPCFHSADWDHSVDWRGRSVAVIGNAASAVQFIPHLAEQAANVTIFQRGANWVSRKLDRPYTERQKALMRRVPLIKKLARLKTYLRNEWIVYPAIKGNRLARWLLQKACENYLHETIRDPEMRRQLTPDYPIGAKRILVVDGYYEALASDSVQLVTAAVDTIEAHGVRTRDGELYACDALVFGTGFITNPFLDGLDIRGREGRQLAEHWSRGAHAYLGVATHHFPNLFFLYGPNTNLGHNSILLMSESQARYIIEAIKLTREREASALEVRAETEQRYDHSLQERLQKMAWSQVADSWYMSEGRVTNNWPGSVGEYRRILRRVKPQDFIFRSASTAD